METTYIAGESSIDLGRALRELEPNHEPDGMVSIHGSMETAVAAPLWRAVMRIEAELLAADADALTAESGLESRTADQRRCDAFVELCRRLAEAHAPSKAPDLGHLDRTSRRSG